MSENNDKGVLRYDFSQGIFFFIPVTRQLLFKIQKYFLAGK
jgi:hypothetical protein